jgi:hypothetical protein
MREKRERREERRGRHLERWGEALPGTILEAITKETKVINKTRVDILLKVGSYQKRWSHCRHHPSNKTTDIYK